MLGPNSPFPKTPTQTRFGERCLSPTPVLIRGNGGSGGGKKEMVVEVKLGKKSTEEMREMRKKRDRRNGSLGTIRWEDGAMHIPKEGVGG